MFISQDRRIPVAEGVTSCKLSLGSEREAKNWFAVFVTPRHEKRVEQHCHIRGIQSFLPLYQTQRRWKDGSKPILHLPLFPGYIFARVGYGKHVPILEVPGVILIVSSMGRPLAVPDSCIHFLQEAVRQGKIEPHPYLKAGSRVRIRSGALAGAEGILIRKKNTFRVVLTLDLIMRSVTVEVAIEDIESVGSATPAYLAEAV